ncbi:MAG: DUF624 domain-containing protein [Eubacteriales bacterium]|nr:DUF624 domain-containing protein [Eubacteriales bacterium]
MKKFFGMDTRLYRFCAFVWNLIYLNLLTLILCIPVITAGASLTAMHYVLLKLVRKEEGYIGRMFWNAFKENFKQATILWIAVLALFFSYRIDWVVVTSNMDIFGKPVQYGILILASITFLLFQFLFPVLSHFENTVFMTVQNTAFLCVSKFPRTIVMAFSWIIPYEILTHSLALFPLVLMLGFTFPGFICAKMYDPVFKLLEPVDEEAEP